MMTSVYLLQVRELTKEWTNKWNETQNILKVSRHSRMGQNQYLCTKLWINAVNPECIDATRWWNWREPKIAPPFDFPPCIIITQEETLALRKEGIGVVLDSELPHLIGIDDDLLSTGIILYHLKVWLSRGKLSDIDVLFPVLCVPKCSMIDFTSWPRPVKSILVFGVFVY